MMVYLLVVSSDSDLVNFIGIKKTAVFPMDSVRKGFLSDIDVRPIANAVDAQTVGTPADLEALVVERAMGADILIVMVDRDHLHLVQNIRAAALVCVIDPVLDSKRYQNYLHERLGKLLKTINHLSRLFSNSSDSKLLSLPLRNFESSALKGIFSNLSDDPCVPGITASIDSNLQLLRRRVRPRKKSKYRNKYAVDDRKRFFVYGNERHSLPETGSPHQTFCMLNAHFRFGHKIDHTRHYNVSQGEGDTTQISGVLPNCHSHSHSVKNRTHINMFSNDFFDYEEAEGE